MDTMSGNEPDIRTLDEEKDYPLIEKGNTAEIYDYSEKVILKLFREGMPQDAIVREERCAEVIGRKFPDTPHSFGVVRYRNRVGILYEKVSGTDMSREMFRHPFRIGSYGKTLARLHLKMHQIDIELPYTLKDKLKRDIASAPDLTEHEKEAVLKILQEIPEDTKLCHNDFHPGNIMMANERYIVIDWLTAAAGKPAADVSRTLVLSRFGEPMNVGMLKRVLIRFGMSILRGSYLKHYLTDSGIDMSEIRMWMLPVAAARLSERLTEHERDRLLRFVRKQIAGNGPVIVH